MELYLGGFPSVTGANDNNNERQTQLSRSEPELHQTVVRLDVLQMFKPQLRQSPPSSDINILLIHCQLLL